MSKFKAVMITVVTVIVLGMAVCYFYKPLYYRLYLGDRITGSIKASVDGVPVILDKDCFISSEGFTVTVNEFDTAVSLKGGEYGTYSFGFFIQSVNKPVQITVCHRNWWAVTDFQLDAQADTDGNIVSFALTWTSLDEKGEEVTVSYNKNIDADNEELELILGVP